MALSVVALPKRLHRGNLERTNDHALLPQHTFSFAIVPACFPYFSENLFIRPIRLVAEAYKGRGFLVFVRHSFTFHSKFTLALPAMSTTRGVDSSRNSPVPTTRKTSPVGSDITTPNQGEGHSEFHLDSFALSCLDEGDVEKGDHLKSEESSDDDKPNNSSGSNQKEVSSRGDGSDLDDNTHTDVDASSSSDSDDDPEAYNIKKSENRKVTKSPQKKQTRTKQKSNCPTILLTPTMWYTGLLLEDDFLLFVYSPFYGRGIR